MVFRSNACSARDGNNPLVSPPRLRQKNPMNLPDARSAVLLAIGRMNSAYNKVVFDEWVLAKVSKDQGSILTYEGPRAETYQKRFKSDIAPLQMEMTGRKMNVGDFEFVQSGHGTFFDACMRLGPAAYLFCNNTNLTMTEIRQDPRWLVAQAPFVELGALFHRDPVE